MTDRPLHTTLPAAKDRTDQTECTTLWRTCGVKAAVVSQLAGDDLQGAGKGVDEQLRLAGDAARVVPAGSDRQGSQPAVWRKAGSRQAS